MASLQPPDVTKTDSPIVISRDRRMDWQPDLVLDATEWIQRAVMGDPEAGKVVCLQVAPALLQEVKKARRA